MSVTATYPTELQEKVDAYLESLSFGTEKLGEAMRYSLLAGASESDRCWRSRRLRRWAATRRTSYRSLPPSRWSTPTR